MKTERLSRLVACALLLLASSLAAPARAQETAAAGPPDKEQPVEELLRAVGGAGQKDAQAWFRLGVAQDAAGDHAAALKSFRQAAKLRPDFALARAGAAHVLYRQGKFKDAEKEAVKASAVRRTSDDMIALNVVSDIRSGRQAGEAAAELARAERELARKPGDARWHQRRAIALLAAPSAPRQPEPFRSYFGRRPAPAPADEAARRASREAALKTYTAAAESLDTYLRLKPNADDRDFVREQLEALRFYTHGEGPAPPPGKAFTSADVDSKAVILAKPDPGFTEEARKSNVTGVVRLRAVLAADGKVRHILVIRGLPQGLSKRAVEAARKIKFKPAVHDGRTVSQSVTLEYNFNIYY